MTLSEWNAANMCILYKLIETKQLPTYEDVKSYLAYTIKINQLTRKYKWISILIYDEEFRIAQLPYSFPWSFDCHHMHSVHLIPQLKLDQSRLSRPNRPKNKIGQGYSPNQVADRGSNGQIICRKFNNPFGCNLKFCNFSHSCNRLVNGQACSKYTLLAKLLARSSELGIK